MIAAVDIGGTKTLVAVFDSSGKIIEKHKFPTPKDYDKFKIVLTESVANFSTKDFKRTVVAIPGRVDRKKGVGIRFGNLPWKNVPIQVDCEKIFQSPVNVENDAKLAGLSEAIILKNKFSKILYFTISTGIGIALITDCKIDSDMSDSGGNSIMIEYQGKITSWESIASGKAIVDKYGKRASEINDKSIWNEISRKIAAGMLEVIALTEPEVVVVGGGVGAHFDKFGKQLEDLLKQYETPMMPIPPLIKAKQAEEAVIYGCYEYASQITT